MGGSLPRPTARGTASPAGPVTAPRPSLEPWRGLEGLRAQEGAWRALAARSRADPLAADFDWTLSHAEAFAPPASLFGWTLSDTDGPVALFALRDEPSRGRLALRRAIASADGTFDTDYLEPLVAPGREEEAWEAVLDALADRRGPEAVVLAGTPDDAASTAALRAALDRRGWPRREAPVPCCAAPLPASFDAYLAGLKARMRSKVRSAMRRAAESGARLRWTRDAAELPADLETLYALHAARWRARGEPGSFAQAERRAFYARLGPRLLARGALRLALLEVDGEAVAAQIGPVLGGAYYQLQEGFDPAREKERVGTALRGLCVRRFVQDEQLERYDFMAGVTRHKEDWGAEPRPCTTIAFALPRVRSRLTFAAKSAVEGLRRRLGR